MSRLTQVTQEQLLHYVHFNRHHNTMIVQHNTKLIDRLRWESKDLLERNWNITSLVRNHISFMNPPRRNVSSFRTNGMQAYIIQYTILMMIQWYIFVYIIYTFYPLLSPPPCSWLSLHNGQEEWLVTTSSWQPLSWILPNFSLTLSSYLTQHLLTWLLQLTIKNIL